MEKIAIDGLTFDGIAIPTAHTKILLIRGEKAHLGCGYFSLAPADFRRGPLLRCHRSADF